MDTGRRHMTSDLKTKDLKLVLIAAAEVSTFSCSSPLSPNSCKEGQVIPVHLVAYVIEELWSQGTQIVYNFYILYSFYMLND